MNPNPLALVAVALALTGCGSLRMDREPEGVPRKETIFAVTESNKLVSFNAGTPQKVTAIGSIAGMEPAENVAGIDFRVARGVLYALGTTGRLYTIDTKTAAAKPVGTAPPVPLSGTEFGFDFNPTVDRIRVVSNAGQNFRLHPDTGAMVDGNPNEEGIQPDGPIAYVEGDVENVAFRKPRLVAAAYTYNKKDPKITTNYAIDAGTAVLVTQGTKEGVTPAVSPNTGKLYHVGSLGVSPFTQASFDIADVTGAAFASITYGAASKLYLINLDTGAASLLGTIGGGEKIRGISVEP